MREHGSDQNGPQRRQSAEYQQQGQQPPRQYQQAQGAPPAGSGGQQQPPPQQQYQQSQGAPPARGGQQQPPPQQQYQQSQGGQQYQQAPPAPAQPRPRFQPVTVDDIIETDVVTAQRDTPVATVVAEMAEKDVGSVVVVEDDSPVGIITDRQVALALETTPDISQRQADELVTGDLLTGHTDMNVFDALRQLSEADVRRLPIVDEDDTLAGIVTVDDILVLLGAELNNVTDIIRAQSPRL